MSDLTMSEEHLDQLARNADRALAQGATSVQTVYAADLAALTAEVRRLRATITAADQTARLAHPDDGARCTTCGARDNLTRIARGWGGVWACTAPTPTTTPIRSHHHD